MNIQDESFPDDEFLDELNFSSKNNGVIRFEFPHHHRCCGQAEKHQPPSVISATNTSAASSSPTSSTDRNLSSESNGGRPSSGLSGKTTESDPTGLADNESKKTNFNGDPHHQHNKAVSYQDIHSEYTKRRYKHVESKVGQYIANMKAEDQKRRNLAKFQRHRSMPDTLGGGSVGGSSSVLNRETVAAVRRSIIGVSANELHAMNESTTTTASDAEEELQPAANSSENTSGGGGGGTTSAASTSGSAVGRHEASDDCGVGGENFIDKQTYAQLIGEKDRIQSYSEYLQTRLDEKINENMRLKRNVDFMRIELSNAKDKLQKKNSIGSGIGVGKRHSLQAILYCQSKSSRATQTELLTPSPPPLRLPPLLTRDVMHFVTLATPDANNNNSSMFEVGAGGAVASSSCKGGKNVATIQPLSLNFSNIGEQDSNGGNGINSDNGVHNSNSSAKTAQQQSSASDNSGCPSSSGGDSAIEIESTELRSPRASLRKLISPKQRGGNSRRGVAGIEQEFIYYDKRSGRYATVETLNISQADSVVGTHKYEENDENVNAGRGQRKTAKKHQHNSLRRRWLRLFGPCTRCDDHNQSLDNSALQQTYTQIPLLEKSYENHCRNLR